MSEELRPCPFCGGELPVHYTVMKNQYVQLISCPDCNATVVSTKFRSDRDALAIWQNRPLEDALHTRIAELEAAQRWIPVSEPPKVSGKYLLLNIYDDVYPCDFIAESESWILGRYDSITHWMPLPESPEVK